MAQEITISVIEISINIDMSTTFSIIEPGGADVFPNTCTKADLLNGIVVIINSNSATSLIVTATSGLCDELASDTVTWTLSGPTPTPTPTPNCDFDVDIDIVTPTPTPTEIIPTPTPNCDFDVDIDIVTPTPTPTPTTPEPTPNCDFDVDIDIVTPTPTSSSIDTPTPTPTEVTPTPTPTPNCDFDVDIDIVTPTPTEVTPTPTPTEVTPTPTPTNTPTPTPTSTPTPTPTPNCDFDVDIDIVTPTPTPTATASSTPTPTPSSTSTPTPTPTQNCDFDVDVVVVTPTPTATATPTPTPIPIDCPPNCGTEIVNELFIFTGTSISGTGIYDLGGFCAETQGQGRNGQEWWYDSTICTVYTRQYVDGVDSSCIGEHVTPVGTQVSSVTHSLGTLTPTGTNVLYDTGIRFIDSNNNAVFVVGEWSSTLFNLMSVHILCDCSFEASVSEESFSPTEITECLVSMEFIVQYSDTEGPCPGDHACNAATFYLRGNTTTIGTVYLSNTGGSNDEFNYPPGETSGYDRYNTLSLTTQQAEEIALSSEDGNITFALICATPADVNYGWGNGECHTNVTWITLKRNGVIIYSACPTNNFFTINPCTGVVS